MQSDQDGPPKETARASFIIGLAALLESYRATLSYDRDDDGIVVSFGDTEVFRGWLYSMEGIQRLRSSVDAAMPKLPEHADLDARRLLARLIAYLPLIGRADLAPTIEPNDSQIAMPRPSRGGSGLPQFAIAASRSSTALKRG